MTADAQSPKAESNLSRLLHADRRTGVEHGALHKPVHISTTFGYATAAELVAVFQGVNPGFVYARQGNPTGGALEVKLALLEGSRAAAGFSTGMAAIAGILLARLKAGDHLVVSRHLFGNTRSLFQTLQGFGIDVDFVDAGEVAGVEAALRPSKRLVFVETVANPGTQVPDLAAAGAGRVVDHDHLPQRLAQGLGQIASDLVSRATCRERHDQRDRLVGVCGMGGHRGGNDAAGEQGPAGASDLALKNEHGRVSW